MPHRYILLVEDDPQCARLAMRVLEKIHPGIHIEHVSDGVRALEYLECRGAYAGRTPQPPTVVLLDLKMPRLDGFGVLERMRALPAHRLHRVVVLSSSAHESDVQRAYDLGACGYVVKNIDFGLFCATLQAVWDFWGVANLPPAPPGGTAA